MTQNTHVNQNQIEQSSKRKQQHVIKNTQQTQK